MLPWRCRSILTLRSCLVLDLYLIRAMNLTCHIGLFPELIRVQNAFLAAAPCNPNIRGHEDILVLASIACRFLRGSIRVRAQLSALVSRVWAPGTSASNHFIDRTQGWDAGGHYDDVGLDADRWDADISFCVKAGEKQDLKHTSSI